MVEMEVAECPVHPLENNWRDLYEINGYLDSYRRFAVVYDQRHCATVWTSIVDTVYDQVAVECPLTLGQIRGQQCWHPDFTRTARPYRNQGLALKLYMYLLRRGLILRSGRTQSISSQRLWGRLCEQPGVEVWNVDYQGNTAQCHRCDIRERPDTDFWDPYQRKTVSFAIHTGAYT